MAERKDTIIKMANMSETTPDVSNIFDNLNKTNTNALNQPFKEANISTDANQVASLKNDEILSGLENVKRYTESELDEEIKIVVRPLFIKAAELAETTKHEELKDKYNKIVDNALANDWLTG